MVEPDVALDPAAAYDPPAIEAKWQQRWDEVGLYHTPDDDPRPRYYFLTMLPYTSGDLHIGHWYAMAPADVGARWQRMQGHNVLFPIGFDAFGLPAENAAIREGVHPMRWTFDNVDRMRGQLRAMGASFDWTREIITAAPEFYRWTQWWFLQLFKHGLAYRKQAPANWCPGCHTVLANEQVIRDADGVGRCERSEDIVETRDLEQWFFRITKYADELLDFSALDWPERIKTMQTHWIGRSEGAQVRFDLENPVRPQRSPVRPAPVLSPVEGEAGAAGRLEGRTATETESVRPEEAAAAGRLEGRTATESESVRPEEPGAAGRLEGRTEPDDQVPTDTIPVFTTRPDTLYGATYLVLAPEHPLVDALTVPEQRQAVADHVQRSRRATEIERQSSERAKSGVFTGAYVRHPLTNARLPVWIADYVLGSYGTGAVMGVPAHDHRDFAFATQFGLPITVVIAPPNWDGAALDGAFVEPGPMVNSGEFDGTPNAEGKTAIASALAARDHGGPAVSYRLRDWLISRQRYWGAPIPIIYCDDCGAVPVPEADLPVLLPEDAEFLPTGDSPLARHDGFRNVACPECGKPARRETDTMDTFMCSSWYMFRYVDPHNDTAAVSPELARTWLPVDQYTGGAEHAVMHLFYARFFTKAARDMGILPIDEPFTRLFNQGQVIKDGHKMSKSRGNVVTPDDWVARLGADTVRLYLMFLGPWEQGGEWDDSGISGQSRWLQRVWRLSLSQPAFTDAAASAASTTSAESLRRLTHRMIEKVTKDIQAFGFNTMLAAMMEYTNALTKQREAGPVNRAAWDEGIESLLLCLAPSAPHITEELWQRLDKPFSIHTQRWPEFDPALTRLETVTLVVQVNGKVRDKLDVALGLSEADARDAAQASERVQAHLAGKTERKLIYVPDRLINFVVG